MSGSIAVLDSGIGGVPYVSAARRRLPEHAFLYVADTANFPYGRKPPREIRRVVRDLVERLTSRFELEAVVLACNTASVVALQHLREHFTIPIVGVVPAVKPAAAESRSQRIGVLATPRTVEDSYLSALIHRFAGDADVVVQAAPELVDFVERRLYTADAEERQATVREALGGLLTAEVDSIVLGCTHFVHLREDIERIVGPETQVLDSVEGVSRQLVRVLGGDPDSPLSRGELHRARRDLLFVTSRDGALSPGDGTVTPGDGTVSAGDGAVSAGWADQYRALSEVAGLDLAGLL